MEDRNPTPTGEASTDTNLAVVDAISTVVRGSRKGGGEIIVFENDRGRFSPSQYGTDQPWYPLQYLFNHISRCFESSAIDSAEAPGVGNGTPALGDRLAETVVDGTPNLIQGLIDQPGNNVNEKLNDFVAMIERDQGLGTTTLWCDEEPVFLDPRYPYGATAYQDLHKACEASLSGPQREVLDAVSRFLVSLRTGGAQLVMFGDNLCSKPMTIEHHFGVRVDPDAFPPEHQFLFCHLYGMSSEKFPCDDDLPMRTKIDSFAFCLAHTVCAHATTLPKVVRKHCQSTVNWTIGAFIESRLGLSADRMGFYEAL